jgi:hypothetical protein
MSAYSITRWDPVLYNNQNEPTPMIYVQPDDTLLKFAENNNNMLMVKINKTDSIYDGKSLVGIFFKNCNIPNCRQNFYKKTGLSIILLLGAGWYNYPTNLGETEIFGLTGNTESIPDGSKIQLKQALKMPNPISSNHILSMKRLDKQKLFGVFFAIIVIFITIMLISRK